MYTDIGDQLVGQFDGIIFVAAVHTGHDQPFDWPGAKTIHFRGRPWTDFPIVMGPSLKGMGVNVSVGVMVAVGVSEGVSVSVGGSVGVGREVCVAAKVEMEILVMVGIGVAKGAAFAARLIQNQAVTTASATKRLTIQNPTTNRWRLPEAGGGMTYPAS